MLSDGTIRKLLREQRLIITKCSADMIQPSSVDLTLGNSFRVFNNYSCDAVDPFESRPDLTEEVVVEEGRKFVLHPGDFVLGTTEQSVDLPHDLVGRVDGKSSLGRLGLLIHATAGFIDPGFRGHITLELSNVSKLPIKLTPTMKICQVSFMYLDRAAERPYGHPELGSKYQGQVGATASEYARNTA